MAREGVINATKYSNVCTTLETYTQQKCIKEKRLL